MTAPALSVILLAPNDSTRIQKTIWHLRAQTRVSEIELLIVTPNAAQIESAFARQQEFYAVKIVTVDANAPTNVARARGVYTSTAPIIAFAEDHAFPSPNWADALLAAHEKPYAAVSVQMHNANPSSISRADMLMSFSNWIAPAVRGEMPMLPGHNTSYKREILYAYGEQLSEILNSEAVMHQDLTRRNHKLFLETRASIRHLNFALWLPFLRHKFLGGRSFAAIRANTQNWTWTQRLLYACGGGAIPLLRFWRMVPDLKRTGALQTLDFTFIAALTTGLIVHAFGEVIGYLFGEGNSLAHYAVLELNRADHLRAEERVLAFE
jgi:hypothetical protein